jgi:hypothetical protein
MPLSRQPRDARWQALVRATLRHRVTVTPRSGFDEFTRPTYGPAEENVACYIDGSTRRFLDSQRHEVQANWQVYFDGAQAVKVNDKLTDGIDLDGGELLASAVVITIDDNIHQTKGRLLRTAYCAVN